MKKLKFVGILLAACIFASNINILYAKDINTLANETNIEETVSGSALDIQNEEAADAAENSIPQLVGDYYQIENADQLYWFAEQVNNGLRSINGKLVSDITINASLDNTAAAKEWIPMGSKTNPYTGAFDGGDHSIRGLYINTSNDYAGLFGCINNANIKGIRIRDSVITGNEYVGAIIGYAVTSEVKNCFNISEVTGKKYVGGVCGCFNDDPNTNNINKISAGNLGTVIGEEYVGGVAGLAGLVQALVCENLGNVQGTSNVGGIFGSLSDAYVIDAMNDGDVSGSKERVGGICGQYNNNPYDKKNLIKPKCIEISYNTGKISGKANGLGGIVGAIGDSGYITNCYNTGSILSDTETSSYTGGIVGEIDFNIADCQIDHCYNTGKVNGKTSTRGICGGFTMIASMGVSGGGLKVHVGSNYYSDEAISTDSGNDSMKKMSASSFKSGEVCYLLNDGKSEKVAFYQTLGKDESPKFEGEIVYFDTSKGYYNKAAATTETTTETTTKAPETTTKAPETTTKAPETTTKAPETTTKAPVTDKTTETTTKAPETTTKAPETTTKAPETTTKAPETTTKAPETTTKVPETTTKAPVTDKTTETTTKASSSSGSGGGGGRGSSHKSSSSVVTTQTTKVENTTEATTEKATEKVTETTEKVTEASKTETIAKEIRVSIGGKEVVIDGKAAAMDAAAYIQKESSSTLVPLRFVALAILGEKVENADTSSIISWDAKTKTATIKAGKDTISFTAGSNKIVVNGKEAVMENGVKAEITDGRMYIPFRALGNALGVKVDWDASSKTAIFKP